MGSALHRLLQWQSTDAAPLTAVALEFALTKEQTRSVQNSANHMLNGEAAWIWDERQIDWQANEYELFQDGKLLRLDRLVRHRETKMWWVIDFKSALEPEKSTALRAQLFAYKEAVSAAFDISQSAVQTAFVSGDGRLINSGF